MTVTVEAFREAFPPFSSPAQYPTTAIQFWLDLGYLLLNPERWGTVLDYGIQLFVAHNLSLETLAAQGGVGQAPGQITGPVTSASVDKVSYSRDPGAAMDPANGHWNLTTYGLRYIRLVNMFGAGPLQVGVPPGMSNNPYPGAWPGVIYGLSW